MRSSISSGTLVSPLRSLRSRYAVFLLFILSFLCFHIKSFVILSVYFLTVTPRATLTIFDTSCSLDTSSSSLESSSISLLDLSSSLLLSSFKIDFGVGSVLRFSTLSLLSPYAIYMILYFFIISRFIWQ